MKRRERKIPRGDSPRSPTSSVRELCVIRTLSPSMGSVSTKEAGVQVGLGLSRSTTKSDLLRRVKECEEQKTLFL